VFALVENMSCNIVLHAGKCAILVSTMENVTQKQVDAWWYYIAEHHDSFLPCWIELVAPTKGMSKNAFECKFLDDLQKQKIDAMRDGNFIAKYGTRYTTSKSRTSHKMGDRIRCCKISLRCVKSKKADLWWKIV
jgi:hypothetical protein